ncbi:Phosphorelay intermediate protein [Coemansia helicoidea]|uniref:Phosphorelay intermediate protein n=1 Tax=Coemansia helicoidea TaxID=1286919 RepID=A0ACC1KYH0_9FUNG|nr:Phosphorelay intermediate protein [Coemansia helicoidea]
MGGRDPALGDGAGDDGELLESDILDLDVFNQLMLMDDENDQENEFSREIVQSYLDQAKSTFADMDKALGSKDLSKLSSLGHFLKGSSATIGVKRVQECCRRIQYLGKLHSISGEGTVDEEEALKLIAQELLAGKREYQKAEEFLGYFYESSSADEESDDEGAAGSGSADGDSGDGGSASEDSASRTRQTGTRPPHDRNPISTSS